MFFGTAEEEIDVNDDWRRLNRCLLRQIVVACHAES